MDSLEALKRAIIAQVKALTPVQTLWAECRSVNMQAGTMVALVDGLEYDDVLLGIGSDITVPEPGSKVLLGIVENQREATFLLFAERIAQRRINGDANGGMVLADTVRNTDAALISKVNALLAALNAWTPAAPPTPADLVTLKAALLTVTTTPLQPVLPASYENPVVKHG
jgi:hypothetical protein